MRFALKYLIFDFCLNKIFENIEENITININDTTSLITYDLVKYHLMQILLQHKNQTFSLSEQHLSYLTSNVLISLTDSGYIPSINAWNSELINLVYNYVSEMLTVAFSALKAKK